MFILALLLPAATVFGQCEEGFVPIFNGENLDGWAGLPALWSVQDGCIVGETANEGEKKIHGNTFLIWQGDDQGPDVGNFVVRFDYRLSRDGNSGMQYRSWEPENNPNFSVSGYQADFDGVNNYSGILYGEGYRGILCGRGQKTVVEEGGQPKVVETFGDNEALKQKINVEDWNSYEVIAEGFTFTNKINGEVMSICTDEDSVRRATGILAIQIHAGPAMKVEIKNLRLKRNP